MKISKRLGTIASMIPDKANVVDVGCDHGLLSIYLASEKDCHLIATDINPKALDNARYNIKKYHASNIDTILTDGLNSISLKKEDYIVIAGMGTKRIKHILSNQKLSDNLVISSNNQLYQLRKFMMKLGYMITDEKFITDQNKKYIIIKFHKAKKHYFKTDLEYGPISRYDKDYLIYELAKLFEIKKQVTNSNFIVRLKNKRKINKLKRMLKN